MNEWEKWLASRPQEVQRVAKAFPVNTAFQFKDEMLYLVGYSEYDDGVGLICSHINPGTDYNGAIDDRVDICAADTERMIKGTKEH